MNEVDGGSLGPRATSSVNRCSRTFESWYSPSTVCSFAERADVVLRRVTVQARKCVERVTQPLGANANFVKVIRSRVLIDAARALAQGARLVANQFARHDGRELALRAHAAWRGRGQVLTPVPHQRLHGR